jgi:hypothetical protein
VCYPLRPEAWEGPGSEPALVHHAVRRRSSCVAARRARAAAGDAGDWVSSYGLAEGRGERFPELTADLLRLD